MKMKMLLSFALEFGMLFGGVACNKQSELYNDSLSGLTDSAAGSKSLATGLKGSNGNIAQYDGEDLEQITAIARKEGMKTGVITTDMLNAAISAAFFVHAPDCTETRIIMQTQAESKSIFCLAI